MTAGAGGPRVAAGGLVRNQAIQCRIWSHAGSLYRHTQRPADALAANDVARSLPLPLPLPLPRSDPMFASRGHARHAAILGLTGNTGAEQGRAGFIPLVVNSDVVIFVF